MKLMFASFSIKKFHPAIKFRPICITTVLLLSAKRYLKNQNYS
jgi:hypothetical protein